MKKAVLFLFLILIFSCKENLTQRELEYMPYKSGDILTFENKKLNSTYSIEISNIEKIIPDGPQLYFYESIKAKTEKGFLVKINAGYGKHSDPYLEIEGLAGKFYLKKLKQTEKQNLKNGEKLLNDIIILETEKKEISKIKTIYWSISEGIIKYETMEGNIWERVNE